MQQWAETYISDSRYPAEEEEGRSRAEKYLLFRLGAEMYGVGIRDVTEIVAMQRIAQVPDVPHFVKGVVNLRGTVIPVIDLRLRFGMAEREYGDRTCIIVVGIDRTLLGVIVDTVADVNDIDQADIEPPPVFRNDPGRNRYIHGLAKTSDGVIILVEARRLLEEPVVSLEVQNAANDTPATGGHHEAGR